MLLLENRRGQYEFSVFENLLQENQRISLNLTLDAVVQGDFSGLNIVLISTIKKLKNHAPEAILFGHQDDFYAQRKPEKGLITRCDVRAVALAKMQLRADSIVWDIGAGSGSVGLEAAALCRQGYVYAIEKNCADLDLIETNRQRMQLINYSVVCAKAPDKMADWPSPDAVFIGGSAGQLQPLLEMIFKKLRPGGALVMNFITLENLSETIALLKSLELEWQLTQLQASHSKPILHMNRLQADNLVWIVSVQKEK
jgi:precorrin-6Y C5,15-methyltransferase (decarboxylating)